MHLSVYNRSVQSHLIQTLAIVDNAKVLQMSADLESLGEIRRFVRATAKGFHAGVEEADDLVLAVDEAISNVILHGYRQSGWIEIHICKQGDRLRVRLRDQAPPFDPTHLPERDLPRDLAAGASGGLGGYLMRQCVEEIHYREPSQGGNELTQIKRVNRVDSKEDNDEHHGCHH